MSQNQLREYFFENEGIRIVFVDNEPWWVAKDVCEVLDINWNGLPRILHVPEQWRKVTSVVTIHGEKDAYILSEAGLFFFLNRSDKPKALPFQMWIAGEVLPQIRRTGRYSLPIPHGAVSHIGPDQDISLINQRFDNLEKMISNIESAFSDSSFTRQTILQLHREYENKPHSKRHGTHRVKCSFQDLYRVEWLTTFWISTLGTSITEKEVITLAIDALIEKLKLELKGEKPSFAIQRTSIPLNPHRIPYDTGVQHVK